MIYDFGLYKINRFEIINFIHIYFYYFVLMNREGIAGEVGLREDTKEDSSIKRYYYKCRLLSKIRF